MTRTRLLGQQERGPKEANRESESRLGLRLGLELGLEHGLGIMFRFEARGSGEWG